MARYKSIGTLHYSLSLVDGKTMPKTIFTPSADYSLKHNGKDYAIFVSGDLQTGNLGGQLIEYNPKKHKGIDLSVGSNLLPHAPFALLAAKDQIRVEIEVENNDASGLQLVGLTVPAV